MLSAKFGEICPVVLDRKIFQFHQCIITIWLSSPLGKGVPIHLNKLKSPLPNNALCWVWLNLNLIQWFWRRQKCEKFTMTTQFSIRKALAQVSLDYARKKFGWVPHPKSFFPELQSCSSFYDNNFEDHSMYK